MSKRTSKRLRAPLPHFVVVLGLTALIFPVAASWVWGGGWIAQRGFYDFAGGAVIHLSAGICALMASIVIGPRGGRVWGSPPRTRLIRTLLIGILLLACGLFAYNPASVLDVITKNGIAGKLLGNGAVAVLFGAGAAGLCNMLLLDEWRWDAVVKGALAGAAAIAAGSAWVDGFGAAVIGAGAGLAARATMSIFEVLRIDDRLDTFAIHGVGGAMGTLAAGLFLTGASAEAGALMGGDLSVLFDQFIGVVAVAFASGVAATALLLLLDAGGWLRWSEYAIARQAARQSYEAAMAEDGG